VAVREALAARAPVREVFVTPEHAEAEPIERAAAAADAAVVRVTASVLQALSDTTTPQGVVAVAEMTDVPPGALPQETDLVVVLDQIRDPGNAGTLLRCAAAAGAGAAVFTRGSVDPYSPKTVRAAAGALFRIAVVRDASLPEAARMLADAGLRLVGADASAPAAYDSLDYTGAVAFVVGNEAWGIEAGHRDLLGDVVGIPMPGDAESLNAAIAGAILLFEAVRQRRISSAAT
jgi:TrmH family RNA methyltransferase